MFRSALVGLACGSLWVAAWSLGCDARGGAVNDAGGRQPSNAGGTKKDAEQSDGAVATDATAAAGNGCDAPGLVWKTGEKTHYESYPAPGSEECVKYSGCDYLGQFQACANTMPESWVEAHNIVSVFPLTGLALHDLCLRSGAKTIVVTAIDTCGDDDCDGCCSENRGSADALIDLEKYTDARFGVQDGQIEWADLGPADPRFDGCN